MDHFGNGVRGEDEFRLELCLKVKSTGQTRCSIRRGSASSSGEMTYEVSPWTAKWCHSHRKQEVWGTTGGVRAGYAVESHQHMGGI